MDRCKISTMAGSAVAPGSKGLTNRQAAQGAIGFMTAATVIMHLRIRCIGKRWRIAVAAGTACCADSYKGAMVNACRMDRCKVSTMTGGAVAPGSKGLACCQADRIVIFIMAAKTRVMHLGISCIGKGRRIAVAAGTACCANRYEVNMTFEKGMDRSEVGSVTCETGYLVSIQSVLNCLLNYCHINL
jgi:hypothetical protein